MWKIKSISSWLRRHKFTDVLFAYSQGGDGAVRLVLGEIATFAAPRKKAPNFKPYQLTVERLEGRLLPSTLQFATPSYTFHEAVGFATVTVTRSDTTGSASVMIF